MNTNSKRERTNASKNKKPTEKMAQDSPAKDRYDLRSTLKAKKPSEKSNGRSRMSWADMCEAADNGVDVSSPFKALSFDSPGGDVSGRKKKREVAATSPVLDGVKRRLGWSRVRNADDGVSTEGSSICSSEDLERGRYETDPEVLRRRQKQIDYGKNTSGYRAYLKQVPKHERKQGDVQTPKKHIKYSRRSWDAQVKLWRKKLHTFDVEAEVEEDVEVDLSDMKDMVQ